MKKIMVALAAVAMAAVSQAAMVDWQYTSAAAQENYTVYLMIGASAQSSWSSLEDVQKAAFSYGTVAKQGSGGRATYGAIVSGASGITASDSVYAVIVNTAGDLYGVGAVTAAGAKVYDPSAQQSSPGNLTIAKIDAVTTPFSSVPEPTSGLLLLLGVAGLALRRRRA